MQGRKAQESVCFIPPAKITILISLRCRGTNGLVHAAGFYHGCIWGDDLEGSEATAARGQGASRYHHDPRRPQILWVSGAFSLTQICLTEKQRVIFGANFVNVMNFTVRIVHPSNDILA